MPWWKRNFAWASIALDWLIDTFWTSFHIVAMPRFDTPGVYPGGEDWRASGGAADVRFRAHQARSLAGRRVSGMVCSGDLGERRVMLVG